MVYKRRRQETPPPSDDDLDEEDRLAMEAFNNEGDPSLLQMNQ